MKNKITDDEFTKLIAIHVLTEYGIRITSDELKMLIKGRVRFEIPTIRWKRIMSEISSVSGMIEQ
jgi:hypothetical protein